jgi:hypothetical protein
MQLNQRPGYEPELATYEGLQEAIQEEGITFGEVAGDYGKPEAVTLISDGSVWDYGDGEITLRESRFPEAEQEYEHVMDYDIFDAAKSSGKALGSVGLPVGSGLMAVKSGGDPFWVAMTGGTGFLSKDVLKKSAGELAREVGKWKHSRMARKQYDLSDVDKEDFEMRVMDDESYSAWMHQLDPEDEDIEIREAPAMNLVGAFQVGEDGELENLLE